MFLLQSLLSEEMFKLSNIAQVQGETESDTEKNIPYGKEMQMALEVKQNLFKLRSPEHAQNCMK